MCSESKYYIRLMILQYYVEPLSRVASRGFSKNQICRTGCGHTREREGWPTAPLPVSRPRPGSARSWKREVLANYLDPKVPGPSFPRGWGSSLQLFAHGRGGNWDSRVLCLSVWSAGQCHPRACPAPSRQTANPVFFFLNYVSLISVYLVLGILLLVFKEKRS